MKGYLQGVLVEFLGQDLDPLDGLVDLEIIVRRQNADGTVEQLIIGDMLGYSSDQDLLRLLLLNRLELRQLLLW